MHLRQFSDDLLLKKFNARDCEAFGEVYSLIYDELTYFAARLYNRTTVVASDAVHDAFLYVWEREGLDFKNLQSVKSYLYIVIKNRFLNYISRIKHTDDYLNRAVISEDWMQVRMVESEVYSLVHRSLGLLPSDCAEIFEYHINGWNAREIAAKLNISERKVYLKQAKSIEILKKKLPKESLLLFIFLCLVLQPADNIRSHRLSSPEEMGLQWREVKTRHDKVFRSCGGTR